MQKPHIINIIATTFSYIVALFIQRHLKFLSIKSLEENQNIIHIAMMLCT